MWDYLERLRLPWDFTAKVKLKWPLNWFIRENLCCIIQSATRKELVAIKKKKTDIYGWFYYSLDFWNLLKPRKQGLNVIVLVLWVVIT